MLQSRVASYHPNLLEELLYTDRQLLDGWDKMAAIYLATDWPYFARRRVYRRERRDARYNLPEEIMSAQFLNKEENVCETKSKQF